MNSYQLKNQSYQLTHNGEPIVDLAFDGEGNPTLERTFNPTKVRLFLAVMTLIVGEYPTPEAVSEIILEVRPAPYRKRSYPLSGPKPPELP